MKYMILLYGDPAHEPAYDTPAFDRMMAEFAIVSERLSADGVLVAGEGLQAAETATTLRIRDGKVVTMDGPFAETKEHLGGYYVIDVPDIDAALRYAALMPPAQWGSVEVRPLMVYDPAAG